MRRNVVASFAAALISLHTGACGEAVSPDASAAISVSIKVAGAFPSDRFQIEVDGRAMTLLVSEASLVIRTLSSGTHTVSLVGLPSNCQSEGANPTSVVTSSASLTAVQFNVTCIASSGAIAVAVSVAGYERQLWFQIRVDSGSSTASVRGNATTRLDSTFSHGMHVVQLSGIPHYCEPTGELSASAERTE